MKYIICFLIFIIGLLFGMGIKDWKELLNYSTSIPDWITSIFTAGLFCLAWKTSSSWKDERKPEVTVNLQKNIRVFQCSLDDICRNFLEEGKRDYLELHKDFIRTVGNNIIELELAISQYLIYKPEQKSQLEKFEIKIKDTYCIFSNIYSNDNIKRIESFERRKLRKLNNPKTKPINSTPKRRTSLTDKELLEEMLFFHVSLLQRHLRYLFKEVTHRKLILGKIT